MIARLIAWSVANRFLVLLTTLFIIAAGDIRENVLAALTQTLTRIKAEAISKREIAPE